MVELMLLKVDKTVDLKSVFFCHCWYFLDKVFKFQPAVCNGCHDVLGMSVILNIHLLNYPCIINGINKSEAINLFKKC